MEIDARSARQGFEFLLQPFIHSYHYIKQLRLTDKTTQYAVQFALSEPHCPLLTLQE